MKGKDRKGSRSALRLMSFPSEERDGNSCQRRPERSFQTLSRPKGSRRLVGTYHS